MRRTGALGSGVDTPLTQRQQQILGLLQAGKVNKEIANELGIGLGTVKQHVVALFKKLKVRNRAMAVSRGLNMQPAARPENAPYPSSDGLLERRPCVVLSIALPESAPASAERLLHQTLAAYAFDNDALFLARKGRASDLIFGIQSASEGDLFVALRAAHVVFGALEAQGGGCAGALQGGLTAATAIASMNRHGGWSGEAIASMAIAQARELAHAAKPGQLVLGAPAQDLLRALSPCAPAPADAAPAFCALGRLPWRDGVREEPPLGRDFELARIEAWLLEAADGVPRLVYIEGETGMGKSRLCRHAAAQCLRRGGKLRYFICQPDGGGPGIYALPDGEPTTLDAVFADLAAAPATPPDTLVVDDAHVLPPADLVRLTQGGTRARLVVLAARRLPPGAAKADETLRLGRLTQAAVVQLVTRMLDAPATPAVATAIARSANGVPLFAIELARHRSINPLPLSLRVVIGARMDGLGLDRILLRRVARATAPLDEAELAGDAAATPQDMRLAIEQAIACGVLKRDDKNRLSFKHPLLRQAVAQAQVE